MRQVPARSRGNLSRRVYAFAAALIALASTGCGSGSPMITSLPSPPKAPTGTVMLEMAQPPSAGVQQPFFVARDTRPCTRKGDGQCFDRRVVTVVPELPTNPTGSVLAAGVIGLSVAPPAGAVIGVPLAMGFGALIISAQRNTRAVLLAFADMGVAERFVDETLVAGRTYRVSDDITYESPDLQLRVVVTARLVRASTRERLDRWWWRHEGPTARLADWGENDAQLFRTELQHALRAIAAQAIEQVAPDPVQTPAAEPKG
jgi:hypothetical protein